MIVNTDDVLDLFGTSDEDFYAKGTIEDAIYDGTLHPVEPERNKGKWIISPDDSEGMCSICQYKIYGKPYYDQYMIAPYSFCPNCGADLR